MESNRNQISPCWSQMKTRPLAWWGQVTAPHLFALVLLDAVTFERSVQDGRPNVPVACCSLHLGGGEHGSVCASMSQCLLRGGGRLLQRPTPLCFCLQCGRQEWEVVNKLITSRSHYRSCSCFANHSLQAGRCKDSRYNKDV